ncbi:MAG TPA: hypothetical protein VLT86_12835 [Vicinamibacterales bacterium]|nr:hypothetical protein [Vicinamibacterales bacterium]
MTEARVGRLLAACLHQAILDRLPQRLDFYEHWLHSEGLRDGSIGLAPMIAVLGFLRTEGEAYDRVVSRAGHLAAEWTVASLPALERRVIAWLPRPLRARAALRIASRIVRSICTSSNASARVRRRVAQFSIKSSLFCDVREHQPVALCGFYRAVAVGTLAALGVPACGRVERCHAVQGGACVVVLDLFAEATADPAMAA